MWTIAVVESGQSAWCRSLQQVLLQKEIPAVAVCIETQHPTFQKERFDLVLWNAGQSMPPITLQAQILLAKGSLAHCAARICSAPQLFTFGFDTRDTLTPASLLHEGGMATLQREVTALSGYVHTPQDLELKGLPGCMIQKMAITSVLLACGPTI